MLKDERSRVLVKVNRFFDWHDPSSHAMVLGSTQTLTDMNTRNLPGGKGRPTRNADNLTFICQLIVKKIWEPLRVTTLSLSAVSYKDSFLPPIPNISTSSVFVFQSFASRRE
jgi:hypothetical protein